VLGHISFGVSDLGRSGAFYDAAMAALGFARVYAGERAIGYGAPGSDQDRLLLNLEPGPIVPPGAGFHLAFDAPSRAAVDRFFAAALAHGGADNGAPGLRPRYGADYYAAFVIDPDGYRLEAKHPPAGAMRPSPSPLETDACP
jgi:catechol 2,3-dioxygenase-like lactoylglutathione lyase family enzyme